MEIPVADTSIFEVIWNKRRCDSIDVIGDFTNLARRSSRVPVLITARSACVVLLGVEHGTFGIVFETSALCREVVAFRDANRKQRSGCRSQNCH